MLTDAQKAKVTAALQPLLTDPDFAGVTDILAEITVTPPAVPETDSVDIKPEAELSAAPATDTAATTPPAAE